MNQPELISVILPTYNRAHTVERAIRSVRAQSYPRVELIVVDDGSTDGSAELLRGMEGITFLSRPHGGQAAARNTGLAVAGGTMIATLDSDDTWEPLFLERCAARLQEQHLDFVFANWFQEDKVQGWRDFMTPNPFIRPLLSRARDSWITLEGTELRDLYLRTCPSPSSSALLRRSSMHGGWNDAIRIGDDWGLYLDMILHKECRMAFTMDRLWRKRVEKGSVFEGRDREQLLRWLYIEDFQLFIDRYSPLLSPAERQLLERKYMESLVELAKFQAIDKFNFAESYRLMKRSLEKNVLFTLSKVTRLVATGLISRVSEIY